MTTPSLLTGWPAGSAVSLLALRNGTLETLATEGNRERIYDWASLSKLVVAVAVGIEHDWQRLSLDAPIGPSNSTVADLLAHASGVGIDATAPMQPVGQRRVYSTYGYDLLVSRIVSERPALEWLRDRFLTPLGLNDVTDTDTDSVTAGLSGSLASAEALATTWLRGDLLSADTFHRMRSAHLPELNGVVPGFGSFSPCPWGLGPEVKGEKDHWMGSEWPATSYGHFGKSGSLLLVDPVAQVAVVALSGEPFGPWAVDLWPTWTNEMHRQLVSR
jgi:CubicO group peptidase (beta-lactamase class C family)